MKKKNTTRRRSSRNETKPTKATNQNKSKNKNRNKNNKPKTENQALDNRRNGSVASVGT